MYPSCMGLGIHLQLKVVSTFQGRRYPPSDIVCKFVSSLYLSWYPPIIGLKVDINHIQELSTYYDVHLLYWFLICAANYVDFWYVAILLAYTIFLKIVICCPFFLPNYGHQNLPDATTGKPIIFWLQKCPNWSNFFFLAQ